MYLVVTFSNLIIPMLFVTIVIYGYLNKVDLYESFKDGAKDGLNTVVEIMPTLLGLMISVGILRASGALEILSNILSKPMALIGYPVEAVPLTFMRLVSSSAATSLLLDIFKTHGPDSYIGRYVSIMMSCTETIVYTMSVYFMSVKITKTRYTLFGAIMANIGGIIASLYITNALYSK